MVRAVLFTGNGLLETGQRLAAGQQPQAGIGEVRRGPSGLAAPTHVLFNGGVLNSEMCASRLFEVIGSWTPPGAAAPTRPPPRLEERLLEALLDDQREQVVHGLPRARLVVAGDRGR